ncbi:conserved hypothetical protein [Talaromyces stipitatus ATCC 10500]|uniref:Oxidoreductase-like domain-containing protein n=1 Tax=Talaromyces stipitatus (strain ATCC 10500 / CBS 375.48 / QM 6759 / NRRL 1006) TaxID=441959 RepID=B8MA19_TALSN|nr:uncharacterized protein TSTA_120930 [Talaromyces stipitatus ATCC 10500]EED18348.1 conserved hypothetical protein [Talaromyces stipitatus ATCC 10500]
MERSILTPNRLSILQSLYKSRQSRLTDWYNSAAALQCDRNRGRLSESTSRTSYNIQVKRSFHNTPINKGTTTQNNPETHQAYPLSGYYSDVLSFNQPAHQQPHQPLSSDNNNNKPTEEKKEPTKEEKMSIVFGTRLAGPGYQSTRYNPETMRPESTWQQVNGIPIPPRPMEPDNCCMSGDDLEHWASRVRDARLAGKGGSMATAKGQKGKEMKQSPRKEVASASMSMDDDGGGSETNWDLPLELGVESEEDLFKGIPVGIREFMKTEKKLRENKMHP